MYAGKLVEKAHVEELLKHPKHPYLRALLAAIPDPDAQNASKLREVPPGEPPSLVHPPPGCRYHPRCTYRIDDVCNVEEPPEFQEGPEHFVNCWLYDGRFRDLIPE